MRVYWTLVRRELGAYFASLTGYVVIAAAAFLFGLSFVDMVRAAQAEPLQVHVTEVFFQTPYFWMIMILTAPVITMRLFALEKFSGTFETLMTTPVRETEVVLAKFSAALVFYLLLWLPLLGCMLVVRYYSGAAGGLDWGVIGTTYLGLLLLGCLFVAMGCFASALTRTQTVAAMITLLMGVGLFLVSFLARQLPSQATWQTMVLSHFSLLEHMQDFARGVVDTRPTVFYLSLSSLFVFLTLRVVESRRWK
ncbi:MAG TPA: ABC transporter permease subunit [Verrucomicrobiae bacterium]